ncbi:MAG: hypothetical protein ACTHU0_21940 [Kofleriaceae bacterium]
MSTIFSVAFTAILSLARAPAVNVDAERPRLEELARSIAHAVEIRADLDAYLPGSVTPIPFKGPEARSAAALALVAIAFHESAFRADVATCKRVGNPDPSITLFQLNGAYGRGPYSQAELCASNKLAAERALYIFAHHGSRCGTPAGWFRGYAAGNCGRVSGAARRQCAIWERLAKRAGLRASCDVATVRREEPSAT